MSNSNKVLKQGLRVIELEERLETVKPGDGDCGCGVRCGRCDEHDNPGLF